MPKAGLYLSIEEVAKRFGVNATTIYRLAQKGKLPGFKIGNQWRFSESLLESWVADQVTVKWLIADEIPAPVKNRIVHDPDILKHSKPKHKAH